MDFQDLTPRLLYIFSDRFCLRISAGLWNASAKLIFGRELLYGYLHSGALPESRNLEDYFTCSFAHLWRLLSRATELRSTWRQIKGIRSFSIGACLSLVMFELVLTSDSQDSRIGSEFALQAVLVLGRNLSHSYSAQHRNMCLRV